ncbi:hypothetical protein BpHYR1_051860 [Brachionus plicatilis]|uniref:Uncharacterized protein n=1 Tax=Brachionus plicatilis TaxID=10195 RepID=A0A3M7SI29_BRAPC|nr:hypothetical protein BpHYR1_051860 [Brachionus plicatilis]
MQKLDLWKLFAKESISDFIFLRLFRLMRHVTIVEKGQNENQCSINSDMSLKSSNYNGQTN